MKPLLSIKKTVSGPRQTCKFAQDWCAHRRQTTRATGARIADDPPGQGLSARVHRSDGSEDTSGPAGIKEFAPSYQTTPQMAGLFSRSISRLS
jgi:hypothetical protein